MAMWGMGVMVGPILGPPLGGWLTDHYSWHWVFLINLPIGVIGFIAAMKIMPDHYASHRTRFDLRGYVMLAFAMVVLSLALDGISGLGTPHALVMLMTLAGLAALVGYWLHAANSTAPLFSLALFRVPSYRIGILGNLFSRIGSSAMPMMRMTEPVTTGGKNRMSLAKYGAMKKVNRPATITEP